MATGSLQLPMWYRVLALIVGVVSIALALVVLVIPALGVLLLIFLLGFALLVIGMDRLVTGITGHLYGWSMPMAGMLGGSAPGAPPQPGPPTPPKQ